MGPVCDFENQGYLVVSEVLTAVECEDIYQHLGQLASGPGTRSMLELPWCAQLAVSIREHPKLRPFLPISWVGVQCTYFTKSATTNWLVPTHQDAFIPVAARVESNELKGWSLKEGTHFVRGPMEVLEKMVAVRVHLDDCGRDDGPLRVAPGSHRHGVQSEREWDALGQIAVDCLASRGDAMVMRPLLLHSSTKATGTSLRRVLHFVFGPPELPYGLAWKQAV